MTPRARSTRCSRTSIFATASAIGTRAAGGALAALLEPDDVVVLTGDLGAGKTAFTQGVGEGLGVSGAVVSPTFNILVAHSGRLVLNHFDLYRLEQAEQLEDIDFFGTLESGGVSLIEWGDRFRAALPDDLLAIDMTIAGPEARRLGVEGRGTRGAALAAAWLAVVPGGEVGA